VGRAKLLELDRLRNKFPRAHKVLVQLFEVAWLSILRELESAIDAGATAPKALKKVRVIRGIHRAALKLLTDCLAADRRDILKRQPSFLTSLFDRPFEDIIAAVENFRVADVQVERLDAEISRVLAVARPQERFALVSHDTKLTGAMALSLVKKLEAEGERCWIAPRDLPLGSNWNSELYRAAHQCTSVILLMSERAMNSRMVQAEVDITVSRGIPVYCVKLIDEDVAKLHLGLRTYQNIEWYNRRIDELSVLVSALLSVMHVKPVATPSPSSRAPPHPPRGLPR